MEKKSTVTLFAVMTMLGSSFCLGLMIEHTTGNWPDSWPKELESYRGQARTLEFASGIQENVYEIRFENREAFEKLWPIILKLKDKQAPLRLRRIEKPFKKGLLFKSDKPAVRVYSHVYPAWPIYFPGGRELRPAAPPWPDSIMLPTGVLPEYVSISEDGSTWIPAERETPGDFKWGRVERDFMWSLVKEEKLRGPMYRARTEIELVVDGTIIDLNRILLPPDTPIIDRRFQEKVLGDNKPLEMDAD
jgi:hypothetical protein